jgi:hypothetical protein
MGFHGVTVDFPNLGEEGSRTIALSCIHKILDVCYLIFGNQTDDITIRPSFSTSY